VRALFSRALAAAAALVVAVVASVLCTPGAGAAVPQQVDLTVGQTFETNSTDASGVFTYQLTSDAAEPMPAGSSSGKYIFTIDGTGEITLPDIVFGTVGVYEYKLSCLTAGAANYIYDSQVYSIDVYVTNDTSSPTVLVHLDDGSAAGDKAPALSFTQTYQAPVEPPPAPGPSAQTGGEPAGGMDSVLLPVAGVLAVAGVLVIAVLLKRRKAEENNAAEAALVDALTA